MSTCEFAMQVKRDIGMTTFHNLPIYYEYMCLCGISKILLPRFNCCLFSKCDRKMYNRGSIPIDVCTGMHIPNYTEQE